MKRRLSTRPMLRWARRSRRAESSSCRSTAATSRAWRCSRPPRKSAAAASPTLAFNGTDIAQNNFLLDGTDATHVDNAFMSNGRERGARLQTASSESIQEFRVLSTNYSAEYGRAAGAVVTAITKSGGNKFSGGGYLYLRDDALDARNFFDPPEQPEFKHEAVRRQPRRTDHERDRMFFFANYEGSRKKLGSVQTGTVPSEAFRATVDPAAAATAVDGRRSRPSRPRTRRGSRAGERRHRRQENIWSVARSIARPNNNDHIFGRVNMQDSTGDGPLFVLQVAPVRRPAPVRADRLRHFAGSWVLHAGLSGRTSSTRRSSGSTGCTWS